MTPQDLAAARSSCALAATTVHQPEDDDDDMDMDSALGALSALAALAALAAHGGLTPDLNTIEAAPVTLTSNALSSEAEHTHASDAVTWDALGEDPGDYVPHGSLTPSG